MKTYLYILSAIAEHGTVKNNRTGVDTKALFSVKFRHDLRDGFPLLTTKKINFAKVAGEMFGFLAGVDSVEGFHKYGCDIWDPWGLSHEHYRVVQRSHEDLLAEYAAVTKQSIDDATKHFDETIESAKKAKADLDEYMFDVAGSKSTEEILASDRYVDLITKSQITATSFFREHGISVMAKQTIMDKGYLGPIYGKQWTQWRTSTGEHINQIKNLVHDLLNNPMSRRHIVTGWNPEVIPKNKYVATADGRPVETSKDNIDAAILDGKQALPPCHLLTIMSVSPPTDDEPLPTLHLELIMRSTDVPIGLPFNIASYALLLALLAKQSGMIAGELVIEMVDCHIYEDQIELAKEQVKRTPTSLPTLNLPNDLIIDVSDKTTLTPENLQRVIDSLTGYNPQGWIKYPVAV